MNLSLQSWTVFLGCSTEDAATGVLEKRIRGPIGVPGAYPDPGDLLHLPSLSYCHTTAILFLVFVLESLLRYQRVLIKNKLSHVSGPWNPYFWSLSADLPAVLHHPVLGLLAKNKGPLDLLGHRRVLLLNINKSFVLCCFDLRM